jgi:hypothetical protein
MIDFTFLVFALIPIIIKTKKLLKGGNSLCQKTEVVDVVLDLITNASG